MADGSNDFELFQAPAAAEADEKSDEKFREEMKRSQQAMQKSQKDEGKAKGFDLVLASIIVRFLSQPQNTDLFLLISRVVSLNLPSEFVISVLSLDDEKARQVVVGLLAEAKAGPGRDEHAALAIRHEANFQTLSPELKKEIEAWAADMAAVAGKSPERILEAILLPGLERQISPVLVQLSAFILRNFLAKRQVAMEYEDLRGFMEMVFLEIVKTLASKQAKRLDTIKADGGSNG
jgi:hypothetical protein